LFLNPNFLDRLSDKLHKRIGIKEVGLVEYRFQPDGFEVRHVRAPGQIDVDLEEFLVKAPSKTATAEPEPAS
jgi:hypothetical protein